MLRLADLASARGDTAKAAAVYTALAQDRDVEIRSEARFRHAKLLMKAERNRDAAVLLRQIVDDKPGASGVRIELARLLQVLGDSEAALRQLRAAQAAGLPVGVARLVDRYSEALRAARPSGFSVEVAAAPDSNINHATRSDTLGTIFGDFDIDQESKAKSGLGLSLHGQAYQRMPLGAGDNQLLLRASGSADLYAKSRFNDVVADFAVGPELRIGRNRLNLEAGATQRWFGQNIAMRSARIGATLARPLGRRTQLRLGASAALLDRPVNRLQDGRGYSAQLALERALTPTAGAAVTFGVNREALRDPGYSTTGWRAGLLGWKDIDRATFTAGGEIGRLDADERLTLFPRKRSDKSSRLTLTATLRQFSISGFAPVLRLTMERNRSTVEFYDFKRTRSEFAIVRAF